MKNKRNMLIGLVVATLALAADQLSKYLLLEVVEYGAKPPMEITPFFNLVMVWNQGVSFGMFAGHNQPVALIILSFAICGFLLRWLSKSPGWSVSVALGLVIGGALGNVVDRARFGAVADFFDFHAFGYHWPAFNIADSTIFIGVVVLCWHSILSPSSGESS